MKNQFIKVTHQNHEILEIWEGINQDGRKGYFVIARNPHRLRHQYEWGAFYNMEDGCWGFGHYDFETLSQARKDMLFVYSAYELDLIVKNNLGGF